MKQWIPNDVTGYRHAEFNAIFRCLRALYPKKSATIIANVTANGTDYEVKGENSGGSTDTSSFAYRRTEATKLVIYPGRVGWNGRGSINLTGDACKCVVTGGTKDVPYYVSIRVKASDGAASAVLVCTSTEPGDDGTYLFKLLHEVALNSVGNAVWVDDRRHDWSIGGAI